MNLKSKYEDPQILNALENISTQCIINAGPGAGKTRFLCYKVANLIVNHGFNPNEIIVCTFTEKAAAEIKDRIRTILKDECIDFYNKTGIDDLRIGTIHSILQRLIEENISFSNFKSDIRILDEFERKIFIHNHLQDFNFESYTIPSILGYNKVYYSFADLVNVIYEDLADWQLTDFLCSFFDNIVDLGLDNCVLNIHDYMNKNIAPFIKAYFTYKELLQKENCLDFSQIQQTYWDMLLNPEFRSHIRKRLKYILVDEYQDTNIIQEHDLLESIGDVDNGDTGLARDNSNQLYMDKPVTIVGDINQSLYRFRGAVIDNILTFASKFTNGASEYRLFVNYRSNNNIINLCNEYIRPNLDYYSKNKTLHIDPNDFVITKDKKSTKTDYPVIAVKSNDKKILGSVQEIYNIVTNLPFDNQHKWSDVAILLPSIRYTEANAFKEIFGDRLQYPVQIEFFFNEFTMQTLSALAQFCGYQIHTDLDSEYNSYLKTITQNSIISQDKISELQETHKEPLGMLSAIYDIIGIIADKKEKESDPESYYSIIGNITMIIEKFISLYDKPDNYSLFFDEYLQYVFLHADEILVSTMPIHEDKAQLMTIHKAKGLEFPIVVVGYNKDLNDNSTKAKYKDPRLLLCDTTGITQVESDTDAPKLELRRLFYVAFSRAEDLLIIGSRGKQKLAGLSPKIFKYTLLMHKDTASELSGFSYKPKRKETLKPSFSYTKDIETFNLCPQMYALIQKYGLVVPSEADFSFGKLVHKTIEEINKHIIESTPSCTTLTLNTLLTLAERELDKTLTTFVMTEKLADQRNHALFQVKNYVHFFYSMLSNNKLLMVEHPVSYDTNDYTLNGRIDAVFEKDDHLLVVDIKSGKKQNKSDRDIANFEGQIKLYGSILHEKLNKPVELLIYSTGEYDYNQGRYDVQYCNISDVYDNIDNVVKKIIKGDFSNDGYDLHDVCPQCPFATICLTHK
ncbi:MAG: ATP-dependent helicase [Bacteroidales bacterium]|nr:ATP-dependent helicase [Bacteroidales bacterium]